jgi:ubiquinone/menaquinone biosynthesis C-methylase UbiE
VCDLLELGCGPGLLWLQNRDRIPEGWALTLSDFSPGMLQQARQNLGANGQQFKYEVIDAQSIPFADGSFDGVIANHMLYHVPDREQAFGEIRRVLRPGGRFYASTVGQTHMQELVELAHQFASGAELWDGRPSESFLLENGREQISRWFPRVVLHRYEDALEITEAEPLVAYVASTISSSGGVRRRLQELLRFLEKELTRRYAIHVTKDSGIFEAFRGDGA